MDNLACHVRRGAAADRSGRAEVRYLLPYSPDFNPIERMFSKPAAWLRSAAARTVGDLIEAMGTACGPSVRPTSGVVRP
ncbi:MAG: transposase [Isosphaeraceae bacterium]